MLEFVTQTLAVGKDFGVRKCAQGYLSRLVAGASEATDCNDSDII